MTSPGVSQYLFLLDEAFAEQGWHSLLSNLSSVKDKDWLWVPPGGGRSIRDIVQHVASTKLMYHNHAFGDGTLRWDDPLLEGAEAMNSLAGAIAWLHEIQQVVRGSVAELDDEELLRPRKANWGELKETRWLIGIIIQHDFYHAGEINHLRSLSQETDKWAYA